VFHIRCAVPSDIPVLHDMDIKCNETDWWSEEDWGYRMRYNGTNIMCFYGEPVALIAVDALNSTVACLMKLVVRPHFRRRKIAKQLIAETELMLLNKGYRILRLYVPDRRLDPRNGDDLSVFLTKAGFRPALTMTPENSERGVEDLVLFEKEISCFVT